MSNRLIHETSPYLLQHSNNPVDWYSWCDEAWERARTENKLVIVSIGYSACHWCHVMERESFEDVEVAKLMNKDYICIKVDREERPDVDQFFMDAANIMSGRGGWPLNAFALPDGRPVYAGTYFPKTSWTGLLHELANGYRFKPQKYHEYAEKMLAGIKGLSLIEAPALSPEFPKDIADKVYPSFSRLFDRTNGGKGRAPKFPMPDNYFFLLRYHFFSGNEEALQHTLFSLDKMGNGGIYDQIGGGFARYSTDAIWKVPHFEKMLYDNAQLLGLYSEAYSINKSARYKKIVYQTFEWLQREMLSPEGAFYSALDADSEGEEGKFYVWTENELQKALGPDSSIARDYYGIGEKALWEHDNNILLVASENEPEESKLLEIEKKLLAYRSQRVRPGLDNKILTSWNALMIKGLLKAYNAFGDIAFLNLATQNLAFINSRLCKDGKVFHTLKKGEASIPGFLEDYASLIDALIQYYEATFEEKYLHQAKSLLEFSIDEFHDGTSGYFYFTSRDNTELAARKIDTSDNVISSPNSIMANNLFLLGKYFDNENYISMAKRMLAGVFENILEHGPFYSNWGILLLNLSNPFYEIAICGEKVMENRKIITANFAPDKIIMGSFTSKSSLPLLKDKFQSGKTLLYRCVDKTCELPVEL